MDANIQTASILVAALTTAASILTAARWQLAKKKITQLRETIDEVDDALKDDKVSEKEFAEVFAKLTTLVGKS